MAADIAACVLTAAAADGVAWSDDSGKRSSSDRSIGGVISQTILGSVKISALISKRNNNWDVLLLSEI